MGGNDMVVYIYTVYIYMYHTHIICCVIHTRSEEWSITKDRDLGEVVLISCRS